MTKDTLTAGILGLDEKGALLLDAASRCGYFQVTVVADLDPQKAEKAAARYGCEPYTDYRQLIVQNQVDCLLVAADIHTCDEHLKTAIRKQINVLKLAPPARGFEEALEYVQMAEHEKIVFAIANPARFRSSYVTAHDLIGRGHIEHIFLVAAHCNAGGVDLPAWSSDPQLAGGGVLTHDCYQILDQILWNFSLPQQVYALKTNQALDKQQRLYLTEDTAVVSMKFTDALLGNVVATRCEEIGPDETALRIFGRNALLTITPRRTVLRTHTGLDDQEWDCDEDDGEVMERLLSGFAQRLMGRDEPGAVASAAENLKNMAVLEAAYLSARTGCPEEPARILQLGRNPSRTATSI